MILVCSTPLPPDTPTRVRAEPGRRGLELASPHFDNREGRKRPAAAPQEVAFSSAADRHHVHRGPSRGGPLRRKGKRRPDVSSRAQPRSRVMCDTGEQRHPPPTNARVQEKDAHVTNEVLHGRIALGRAKRQLSVACRPRGSPATQRSTEKVSRTGRTLGVGCWSAFPAGVRESRLRRPRADSPDGPETFNVDVHASGTTKHRPNQSRERLLLREFPAGRSYDDAGKVGMVAMH